MKNVKGKIYTSALGALVGCVIVLATQYKIITTPGDYNGISVGDSVETNIDYERHCSSTKMIGKVIGFLTYGEEYPVAVLESGIEISVYWLERRWAWDMLALKKGYRWKIQKRRWGK
ncbi:MAG: hypothetical protein AAB688_00890 [Patescibacteria group bacterium]